MKRDEVLLVLDLGYRQLTVRRVPLGALDGDKVGVYQAHEGEVWILRDLEPREELHTLLHELLHAVWSSRQVDPDDDEERTVAALADGLTELLVRNPELFELLSKRARDGGS